MENEEKLPKPQTDLPLPEKEISEHATPASQGDPLRSYSETKIYKNKFFLGFVAFSFLIAFLIGGFVLGKNGLNKQISKKSMIITSPSTTDYSGWKTYTGKTFSIKYPANYQLNENKIVATEGIVEPQENTIQLISPVLPKSNGNLSLIFAYKPTKLYLEQAAKEGSNCAELSSKKLTRIKLGANTFSESGLLNCGPSGAAFFYFLTNGYVYEAKVETTANYQKDALPIVKQILSTLKFTR